MNSQFNKDFIIQGIFFEIKKLVLNYELCKNLTIICIIISIPNFFWNIMPILLKFNQIELFKKFR